MSIWKVPEKGSKHVFSNPGASLTKPILLEHIAGLITSHCCATNNSRGNPLLLEKFCPAFYEPEIDTNTFHNLRKKYISQFKTNIFHNLRQIHFTIWDKFISQFETNIFCTVIAKVLSSLINYKPEIRKFYQIGHFFYNSNFSGEVNPLLR